MKHLLYKTGDVNVPKSILDSNGEVVLALCINCGRGEIELDEHPTCDNALRLKEALDLAERHMNEKHAIQKLLRDLHEAIVDYRSHVPPGTKIPLYLRQKLEDALTAGVHPKEFK